ncbi:hypothetical protein [Streptomyces acidiscabies]|uniref:hypothetical protein n=1 Tax=Streptomyces acidiscabies TaxID=42234 RepID=UPI00131E7F43|nr:hypothetical protein [Streptomyces acidiscabies]
MRATARRTAARPRTPALFADWNPPGWWTWDGSTARPVTPCRPRYPCLRLDYFYATAQLAATTTDYRVLRNAETDRISDHYPIVVDLDVTRLGPTTAEPS